MAFISSKAWTLELSSRTIFNEDLEACINIICISNSPNVSRCDMLTQTIRTLRDNANSPKDHTMTLVLDAPVVYPDGVDTYIDAIIAVPKSQGASASRNMGAGSIRYAHRQKYVMFVDDDIYAVPGWDHMLETRLNVLQNRSVVSGHSHPFNHHIKRLDIARVHATNVLSTVHMVMSWGIWDSVGDWPEPGGPGGSEDVEWCKRAVAKGYGLAVSDPECIIHTGLRSSSGNPIVGHGLMVEKNAKLISQYGLDDKVVMSV